MADSPDAPTIIINGASSSVGACAVQLAKRAGLFVVGVAGASKAYAKSIGVDIILDYRDYNTKKELVCGHRLVSHLSDLHNTTNRSELS